MLLLKVFFFSLFFIARFCAWEITAVAMDMKSIPFFHCSCYHCILKNINLFLKNRFGVPEKIYFCSEIAEGKKNISF